MGAPSKTTSSKQLEAKPAVRSKTSGVTAWLEAISCLAVILIFLIPPSSQILFPAFTLARQTGSYPDGLPLRRSYTGITVLDFVFTGLAGFFSAAVDGKDEATCLFCLWFLPQLSGILTFCYWEAGRAKTFFTRS